MLAVINKHLIFSIFWRYTFLQEYSLKIDRNQKVSLCNCNFGYFLLTLQQILINYDNYNIKWRRWIIEIYNTLNYIFVHCLSILKSKILPGLHNDFKLILILRNFILPLKFDLFEGKIKWWWTLVSFKVFLYILL